MALFQEECTLYWQGHTEKEKKQITCKHMWLITWAGNDFCMQRLRKIGVVKVARKII